MFSRLHNRKGFTLIELMIVVVIIGILAALAIPRFMQATTKSKQSEAKQILKQIYTMERAFRQETGSYSLNLNQIGVEIMADARYAYVITSNDLTAEFLATAAATVEDLDDDAAVDTWTIDQDGTLTNTINDVTT
ncbi:MAG: prepilin-type N-terminal cleavage/methylation domain-containing protein [Candidatus Zixiibacteriota bacterium]